MERLPNLEQGGVVEEVGLLRRWNMAHNRIDAGLSACLDLAKVGFRFFANGDQRGQVASDLCRRSVAHPPMLRRTTGPEISRPQFSSVTMP